MPPKRNARRKGSASSGSDDASSNKDGAQANKSLNQLAYKPCLCCGREISPRAKWARNWDSIKYCSDQCKGWRSVVSMPGAAPKFKQSSILQDCIEKTVDDHTGDSLRLHIDAWLETTILQMARSKKPTGKHDPLPTLSHAGEALHLEISGLKSFNTNGANDKDERAEPDDSPDATTQVPPFLEAFLRDTKPGEREMLRRAARRLLVLPHETLASTRMMNTSTSDRLRGLLACRLVLTQHHGKTRVSTLHDVSHAKGDLEIQVRHENDTT